MNKTSIVIPIETIRKCRGVLVDMGSTLLEFENTPLHELIPGSLKSAYDYLLENSSKSPDWELFSNKFRQILKYHQHKAVNEYREYKFNDITTELLTAFRIPPTPEIVHGFFEHYYIKITQQVTVYPDSRNTLSRLKAAKLQVCVVSNSCFPGKVHRAELARFGLLKFIDATVFSSDIGLRKPHREIYQKALTKLGLEPDETVFVGDRQLEDALGPQMAGVAPVLVRRPHRKYEAGLTSCPEINSLNGLPGLLEL